VCFSTGVFFRLIFFFSKVATKNSHVLSLPRRLLDPRRPNRKPTSEEVEEQLIQYEPVLQHYPQRVLSHNYEVQIPLLFSPS
jgi:hypothetical protein